VADISVFFFFFWRNFAEWRKTRKPMLIVQGIFWGGKKLEKSPYFEEKNSHVAIF